MGELLASIVLQIQTNHTSLNLLLLLLIQSNVRTLTSLHRMVSLGLSILNVIVFLYLQRTHMDVWKTTSRYLRVFRITIEVVCLSNPIRQSVGIWFLIGRYDIFIHYYYYNNVDIERKSQTTHEISIHAMRENGYYWIVFRLLGCRL